MPHQRQEAGWLSKVAPTDEHRQRQLALSPAALISAAQAVEHYEITRYGTMKRWAEMLGFDDAAELLAVTLAEEAQTDEDLTELAENGANEMAQQAAE